MPHCINSLLDSAKYISERIRDRGCAIIGYSVPILWLRHIDALDILYMFITIQLNKVAVYL